MKESSALRSGLVAASRACAAMSIEIAAEVPADPARDSITRGLHLLRAFHAVEDAHVQEAIVRLVERIAAEA